ncbi:MAG: nucleotidyltransferase family protein [Anaerolineaceae bacterium]
MKNNQPNICAVVLAAGLSSRMGTQKMLLQWGVKTILTSIIDSLMEAHIQPIIVVTGANAQKIEKALKNYPVSIVFNPLYSDGEMLHSVQTGLNAVPQNCKGVMVVLGDQPQIDRSIIESLCNHFLNGKKEISVPSYNMRRGHPWIFHQKYVSEIQSLKSPQSLRDFFEAKTEKIEYLLVDTPAVIKDIDTPDDYENEKPKDHKKGL